MRDMWCKAKGTTMSPTLYDARIELEAMGDEIRDKILEFQDRFPDLRVMSIHVFRIPTEGKRRRVCISVEASLASGTEPRFPTGGEN